MDLHPNKIIIYKFGHYKQYKTYFRDQTVETDVKKYNCSM